MIKKHFKLSLVFLLILSTFAIIASLNAQQECNIPKPTLSTYHPDSPYTSDDAKQLYDLYFQCAERGSDKSPEQCPEVYSLSSKMYNNNDPAASCSSPGDGCPYWDAYIDYNKWINQCQAAILPETGPTVEQENENQARDEGGQPESIIDYTSEQGNLKEWTNKLKSETSPESDVSKQLDECEKHKQNIITQCQQSPGGWSVDVSIGISDGNLGKNYGFQDYKTGGCKKSQKFRQPLTVNIDNKFSSAADKNYQVSCNMLCSSWNCEDTYLALVDEHKGQVSIIRNGVPVTIGLNTPIQEGDLLITGPDGEISLKLVGVYDGQTGKDDKSYVKIDPNTKLKIIDPEVGALLLEGNAKTHIEKSSNRKYAITTPAARVIAKGTDFLVSVEANTGRTVVYLYEGTLQIIQLQTNEYITIKSNEKVTIDAQGFSAPTQILDEKSGSAAENQTFTANIDKSKGGFSSLLIVIFLILAAVLAVGYYFFKMRKKKL